MQTKGSQSDLFELPPGRHCFRLFMESPCALALKLHGSTPDLKGASFVLGTEDMALSQLGKEPLLNINRGKILFSTLCSTILSYLSEEKPVDPANNHKLLFPETSKRQFERVK